jgi:hypothetical protein
MTSTRPAGVTLESVRRSISTKITDPSAIAIGPSGNRNPDAICLISGRLVVMHESRND